jgi:hypothetical protein
METKGAAEGDERFVKLVPQSVVGQIETTNGSF